MKSPETATDWSLYDVPTIATMLNDDYDAAWDQVMAWRYAYETISEHRTLLSRARAELAEGWPPEQSIASARYFETIDGLDRSLADTSDAAIRNSNALADVLTALSQARASIGWLHESWRDNVIAPAVSSRDPMSIGTSINAEWMMHLNTQAHEIMAKTDQTIFENTRQLKAPPLYDATIYIRDSHPIPGATADPISTSRSPKGAKLENSNQTSTLDKGTPIAKIGTHTGASQRLPIIGEIASGGPPPSISNKEPENGRAVTALIGSGLIGAGLASRSSSYIDSTFNTEQSITQRLKSQDSMSKDTPSNKADPEASGMLSPGMSPPLKAQSRSTRRRRDRSIADWKMPKGVPSLLRPRREEQIYHDPGPGVIGFDR